MSIENQLEIERNEMSEIIAQSFHPCVNEYDPSDFEWSAHCLQMEGYHKKREDGKYIRLEDLQQFPIRKDHYDKKHGSEHFVFGVESVIEYAENLPTYDIAPKSEWISVEERLPEDVYGKDRKQITTLVYTRNGRVSTASRMRIVKWDKTKLEWVTLDTFEWSRGLRVTHWMPLPEAPKKGGASDGKAD